MAERYLIAIATYRRPDGLQRLLDSMEAAVSSACVDILVVDNDADGSARPVASNHALRPTYVTEPESGVAAARNRALAHFGGQYRGVIFVDDDEWVSPTWLTTLTTYAVQTQADVVVGAVISVFLQPAPEWALRGGFYQRRLFESGHRLSTAPTNNTLLLRDMWIRAGSPRFDSSFSALGGEDTDFFRGLRKLGADIVFCADAVVYEDVPTERMSLRWVRRRAIRTGVIDTLVRLKHHDSLLVGLGRGVRSAVYGAIFLGVGLATRRGLQARPYFSLFYAYGQFAALLRLRIEEYPRANDGGVA